MSSRLSEVEGQVNKIFLVSSRFSEVERLSI